MREKDTHTRNDLAEKALRLKDLDKLVIRSVIEWDVRSFANFLIHGHKTVSQGETKELLKETIKAVQDLYEKTG